MYSSIGAYWKNRYRSALFNSDCYKLNMNSLKIYYDDGATTKRLIKFIKE